MGRFGNAFMNGAQDVKFQGVYNYLLDLLDTAYVVEKRVNNVLRKVTINPDDLISITVGDNEVFGIDENGRVFSSSISNVSSAGYYMTYGYGGSPGLECFFPLAGVATKFLGISPSVNGDIYFYDMNVKNRLLIDVDGTFRIKDHAETIRLALWADGSMQLNDAAARIVLSSSATDTQIRLGAASPDNRIGVNSTGPYFIQGGAQSYMSGLIKKTDVLYSVLSKSSDQTFGTGTSATKVAFDTETGDCSVSSNGCLVPTGNFIAIVDAYVLFDADTTGVRAVYIRNGATTISIAKTNASNTGASAIQGSASFLVTTGDIIYTYAYQNSGGDLNMDLASRMFVTLMPID